MKTLKDMIKILDNVNATNVKVFDYEKKSPFFDYVIIATVSPRQSNAAVNYLKDAKLLNTEKVEGRNTGWTLIDAGDVIIHLFDEEQRKFYNFDDRLLGVKRLEF